MKSMIIVALALVAVAAALPVDEPPKPEILSSSYKQQPDGGFLSEFKTENGIQAESEGKVKEVPDDEGEKVKVVVIRGSFSYTNPDGELETIKYVADENGFRAEGPSIPKAPVARR